VLFQIAKLKILDRTNCHPFCERNLDSSPFLDIQSQEDHSDYCLAYSFTSRDWNGGTLGVAWVAELGKSGGICEKYRRTSLIGGWRSYNTGVVTLKNEGKEIHISKSELTFAHEVGHNLGSPHDESSQCVPEQNGKFLMYAYANSGNLPNNAMFSPCSKKKISTVFTNIGRLNGCLEKFDGSFCGDGIKDDGKYNIKHLKYVSKLQKKYRNM
jgi:disintegrin and metalloproteinase domain-containing protein 10